jgi:hypothetical protein
MSELLLDAAGRRRSPATYAHSRCVSNGGPGRCRFPWVLRDTYRQAASTGPIGARCAGWGFGFGTPVSPVAPVTWGLGPMSFSIRQRSTLP